mmetsp:Transcript_7286/g.18948  ORF Transcript_7286/g.18948 Transcript_7286/m.18948 type:complete len:111 (+) Transcript_7286:335-667(+)
MLGWCGVPNPADNSLRIPSTGYWLLVTIVPIVTLFPSPFSPIMTVFIIAFATTQTAGIDVVASFIRVRHCIEIHPVICKQAAKQIDQKMLIADSALCLNIGNVGVGCGTP